VNVETGVVIRPCLGETVCGDAQLILDGDDTMLIAVIDGLGHGPGAAAASEAFVEYLTEHPAQPVDRLMLGCSAHITSTRGAAAAIIQIDRTRNTLSFCGIGNVHFHAHGDVPMSPVSLPGIVGHRVRKVIPYDFELTGKGMFVLCSDGISSRLHLEDYEGRSVQEVADSILVDHGKSHDDATVVAVAYDAS
jgi:serine/threonine protein phosphatase PrpC